jgi:hypothetical protein
MFFIQSITAILHPAYGALGSITFGFSHIRKTFTFHSCLPSAVRQVSFFTLHSSFFILHFSFFILHSSLFILHSSLFNKSLNDFKNKKARQIGRPFPFPKQGQNGEHSMGEKLRVFTFLIISVCLKNFRLSNSSIRLISCDGPAKLLFVLIAISCE